MVKFSKSKRYVKRRGKSGKVRWHLKNKGGDKKTKLKKFHVPKFLKKKLAIDTFIGEHTIRMTATNRVNPDLQYSDRTDNETKKAIRLHNYLTGDNKDIPIYVAVVPFKVTYEDGGSYGGKEYYWSINKKTAIRGAKKQAQHEIDIRAY